LTGFDTENRFHPSIILRIGKILVVKTNIIAIKLIEVIHLDAITL